VGKRVWVDPHILLSNLVLDSSSFKTKKNAHHVDPYENFIEKGSSQQVFWF
jgi:hypothetical protein